MRLSHEIPPVAVLIATCDRGKLLHERSLPSVLRQTLPPSSVIVVNDGSEWSEADREVILSRFGPTGVVLLQNRRPQGAGGAWNTGLAHLASVGQKCFVAILDDDDEWEPSHLEVNCQAAKRQAANIVVSGLRIQAASGVIDRPLIEQLCDRDFLVGNPGWQGSNTFVDLDLLTAVGGFRESLRSLHDRDLAIRLLRHPAARYALVPKWTATWYIDFPGRLSDYRSSAKLDGLRRFWAIYSGEMSNPERSAFLNRALRLFGFSAKEIHLQGLPILTANAALGDLNALPA